MKEIRVSVDKDAVYDAVAAATAYGESGDDRQERLMTVRENAEVLDGFWAEGCSGVCTRVRRHLLGEGEEEGEGWSLTLEVSGLFNDGLAAGMGVDLERHMRDYVLSRWYALMGDKRAAEYAAGASAHLESFCRKLFNKKSGVYL